MNIALYCLKVIEMYLQFKVQDSTSIHQQSSNKQKMI